MLSMGAFAYMYSLIRVYFWNYRPVQKYKVLESRQTQALPLKWATRLLRRRRFDQSLMRDTTVDHFDGSSTFSSNHTSSATDKLNLKPSGNARYLAKSGRAAVM